MPAFAQVIQRKKIMLFLIRFFEKNGFLLFFLSLQLLAISLIFTRNAMQRSWLAAQTSAIHNAISGYIGAGTSYLQLKEQNEQLVAQNKSLMKELFAQKNKIPAYLQHFKDSLGGGQSYDLLDGDVVYNSIHNKDNYFTINRGKRHGVEANMGVVAPQGIAGIIINTTANHALAQSVLSVNKMRINGALKKSGHFGTLTWHGEDTRVLHLSDIPKYVSLAVGDTVITDGKSAIFPQGINIGRVASFRVDNKTGYWDITVELLQEMANLRKVFIIKNLKKNQIQQIQDSLQATIQREGHE